ncbi:O-antigen ligase family protein [Spirosoma oryzicola]|uniref:O-antigen ligase family protein n=1 Tax=Spirosoma oryzicola TaxID=2898794 RepID=UPI001E55A120|nr:O-antigen ligase family protein [Spirosoma oryzicola]UHG90275.1 O-antigen ligase family protein [Spirosoma oryzicola]
MKPFKESRINLVDNIYWIGVVLLFIPKINIIPVQEKSTGIRLDDIFISYVILLILAIYAIKKYTYFSKIEILLFSFISLGALSNLANIGLYGRSNILYSLRLIEYFSFFYIGYLAKTKFSLVKISYWYIVINFVIIILQRMQIVGGFSSEGYDEDVSNRAIGITGGPWEVGTILVCALCIIIYNTSFTYKIYQHIILIVVFFLLILTGARMPTLAYFIVVVAYFYKEIKNKLLVLVSAIIIIPLSFTLIVQLENPILARSSNLFNYNNVDQFFEYYDNTYIDPIHIEFPEMPIDYYTSDISWSIRASKWSYAIKYWSESYISYIIGLGPGMWGPALDGSWLRILTESGLLGLLIYVSLLLEISRVNQAIRMIVITISINMLMIDIHMSYKCMAFLFLTIGYYYPKNKFVYKLNLFR